MFRKLLHFSFLAALFSLAALSVNAQMDMSSPNGRPQQKEELPKNIQEKLAKQRIDREKKEYEELLARGEEALKLSQDLEKAFSANNKLSVEDQKKLDKLEKVVKKIRRDLGADDDDEEKTEVNAEKKHSSVENAVKDLRENTVKLVDELKKLSRYSISVVAIQSSNLLLKVVKFLRFGN